MCRRAISYTCQLTSQFCCSLCRLIGWLLSIWLIIALAISFKSIIFLYTRGPICHFASNFQLIPQVDRNQPERESYEAYNSYKQKLYDQVDFMSTNTHFEMIINQFCPNAFLNRCEYNETRGEAFFAFEGSKNITNQQKE